MESPEGGSMYTSVKMILETDDEVSKEPFALNGKHQILVSMPQGEEWGDERVVTLEYLSPHDGDENNLNEPNLDWRPVQDPNNGDLLYEWTVNEGFIEVEGCAGILYRLHTTVAGCQASKWPVRNWVSGRPGR